MRKVISDHPGTVALLSSMYLCKPSRKAIEGWKKALAEDRSGLLEDMQKAVAETDVTSQKELEDLLWDYTRLFIGPYRLPCPPWESVYTSPKRLMMQDAADKVLALYREAGLEVNSDDVMPDHIGTELNFLAILLGRSHNGRRVNKRYSGLADKFIRDHLIKWMPGFTKDLEDAAETSLYKSLAKATGNVIKLL